MDKKIRKIKKRPLLSTITILCSLTGCLQRKQVNKQSENTKISINTLRKTGFKGTQNSRNIKKEEHTITVWIHGTRFENSFIRNKIFKNIAYRAFIQNGLLHHSAYKTGSNFKKIAKNLAKQNTKRFTLDNFYIFGWPGTLSHEERMASAKQLYTSLLELIHSYKQKHGIIPKIRFVTHSHGGNLALCFAEVNDHSKDKIKISELVALACPVQVKTTPFIASNTFENIYSLHSSLDMIQVIDPQGLHNLKRTLRQASLDPFVRLRAGKLGTQQGTGKSNKIKKPFFSERLFPPRDNLTQIKLKVNGRGVLHIEFILSRFSKLLPHILQEIDTWKQEETSNFDKKNKHTLLKIRTDNNIKKIKFIKKMLKK